MPGPIGPAPPRPDIRPRERRGPEPPMGAFGERRTGPSINATHISNGAKDQR
jgi:hypothetical protein